MARRSQSWLGAWILILGWSVGARADDWPSQGLTPDRGRHSLERSDADFAGPLWTYSLPANHNPRENAIVSSPAVADGFLLFGTGSNTLRALRASDGQEAWHFTSSNPILGSPTIFRGRVYIAGVDENLYALRLRDGQLLWKQELEGMTVASVTVVEEASTFSLLVVTGFPGRRLVRLDATTGRRLWQTADGDLFRSSLASLAVGDGRVIVGVVGGLYYAFDVQDGHRLWTYEAHGGVNMSSPLLRKGVAYLLPGGDGAELHAIDAQTGLALTGWPVGIDPPGRTAPTAPITRSRAVSSPVEVGGRIVFQIRITDALDLDGNATVDTYSAREYLVAIDAQTRQLAWRTETGRLDTTRENDIPALALCPTPALFDGLSGETLLAATSTLSASLRVLDATTGAMLWSQGVGSPTRSSPIFANGRLWLATDAGTVMAFQSSSNGAPGTPEPDLTIDTLAAQGGRLRWRAGPDREGDALSYTVRIDRDGEVLESWEQELQTAPGVTSAQLSQPLTGGATYGYAVRARDSRGALSDWSPLRAFTAVPVPPVVSRGQAAFDLAGALAGAGPGDVVTVGEGTLRLSETIHLPGGAVLEGMGPHLTTLDGRGLAAVIAAAGGSAAATTTIRNVTMVGGALGVTVAAGSRLHLQNVIVRDATDTGVAVASGGWAEVVNATLIDNQVAVGSAGTGSVKNSLLFRNRAGLVATQGGTLLSRYNDLFGNEQAYAGVLPGLTDLAEPVVWLDLPNKDLRLAAAQPTTDRGDPADEFGNEPLPSGGRINLGAFGNTPLAELSREPPIPDQTDAGVALDAADPLAAVRDASPPDEARDALISPPLLPIAPTVEGQPRKSSDRTGGCAMASSTSAAPVGHACWILSLIGLAVLAERRGGR